MPETVKLFSASTYMGLTDVQDGDIPNKMKFLVLPFFSLLLILRITVSYINKGFTKSTVAIFITYKLQVKLQ